MELLTTNMNSITSFSEQISSTLQVKTPNTYFKIRNSFYVFTTNLFLGHEKASFRFMLSTRYA